MRLASKSFQDPFELTEFVNNVLGGTTNVFAILPSAQPGVHVLYYKV